MAKWKNIALISTIVAPIALGVGDAFAQANRPTNDSDGTTVILHKRDTRVLRIQVIMLKTCTEVMETKTLTCLAVVGVGNQAFHLLLLTWVK